MSFCRCERAVCVPDHHSAVELGGVGAMVAVEHVRVMAVEVGQLLLRDRDEPLPLQPGLHRPQVLTATDKLHCRLDVTVLASKPAGITLFMSSGHQPYGVGRSCQLSRNRTGR